MVLDYLQTMWAQKPVCGPFANNVGSLAAIVGPTSPVFAANVSRQVPLFAGQPADDCGPLQLWAQGLRSSHFSRQQSATTMNACGVARCCSGRSATSPVGEG